MAFSLNGRIKSSAGHLIYLQSFLVADQAGAYEKSLDPFPTRLTLLNQQYKSRLPALNDRLPARSQKMSNNVRPWSPLDKFTTSQNPVIRCNPYTLSPNYSTCNVHSATESKRIKWVWHQGEVLLWWSALSQSRRHEYVIPVYYCPPSLLKVARLHATIEFHELRTH